MKSFKILFIIFLLIGCRDRERILLASNTQIIAKYITTDTKVCTNKTLYFKKMGINDCSFKLENHEYFIAEKFVISSSGKLKEYWHFLPEGPLKHKIEDLKSDKEYFKLLELNKFDIKILTSESKIIDSGDTLKIERVLPSEKLIFVKRDKKMNISEHSAIYEYK